MDPQLKKASYGVRLREYESRKQALPPLPPKDYDKAILTIARELRV